MKTSTAALEVERKQVEFQLVFYTAELRVVDGQSGAGAHVEDQGMKEFRLGQIKWSSKQSFMSCG